MNMKKHMDESWKHWVKENMDLVFNEVSSDSKERLYVNHAHHNLFDENPDQKLIFNHILKFLNEH